MSFTNFLVATGLVVDTEQEQPHAKPIPSIMPSVTKHSVNMDIEKGVAFQQKVLNRLNGLLAEASPIFLKYQASFDQLANVPFPDPKLHVQAALAAAGLTAQDVINALQTNFISILQQEKEKFSREKTTKFFVENQEFDRKIKDLVGLVERKQQELNQASQDLNDLRLERKRLESDVDQMSQDFEVAYLDVETKIKQTIETLSHL